LHGHHVPSVSL